MLLCLDVGNTHILGGVFNENQLIARFRYATHLIGTADQFGIFLINILEANGLKASDIKDTAISSVVPSCDFTIRHTISSYFESTYFMLRSGVKTGLNIRVKHPNEVGADLIADAIGAIDHFPNKNMIIIDMGTATTLSVITKERDYLGGLIMPGLRLSMQALSTNTAKLMEVDIESCHSYIGKTTKECIQAGLYFTHLGALKEMLNGVKQEQFPHEPVSVIGTGGFSQLYRQQGLFDVILPDLVLQGLYKAYMMNT